VAVSCLLLFVCNALNTGLFLQLALYLVVRHIINEDTISTQLLQYYVFENTFPLTILPTLHFQHNFKICKDIIYIYIWVWNGVHSVLVRINEELLERKVAAPV
jgi:hypothetical protein